MSQINLCPFVGTKIAAQIKDLVLLNTNSERLVGLFNRLHLPACHQAKLNQVLQMLRIFVLLLIILVHEEVERWVCELAVEKNSKEVFRILEGVSILSLAVKGVDFELLDAAVEVLNVDLVGNLVEF